MHANRLRSLMIAVALIACLLGAFASRWKQARIAEGKRQAFTSYYRAF